MRTTRLLESLELAGLLLIANITMAQDGITSSQQSFQKSGIPPGHIVIEGDIVVPQDFPRLESAWRPNNFWPGGVVPFEFDDNVSQANRNQAIAAIGEWERVANIDFVPRTNQPDFIHIQAANVNNSFVGRQGGRQDINIFNWNNRFIICHELAHALGIWHEQSRPDRDKYVRINSDSIMTDQRHNFDRYGDAGQYGPYDFESVMHYGQFDFSVEPGVLRTIVILPPNQSWQNHIGQRSHLSHLDTLTMSFIYAQPDWRFADRQATQAGDGSFFRPFGGFSPFVASLVPAGITMWLQPGIYPQSINSTYTAVYTKRMTIKAPLGGVTLGQ